jgi:Fe-S-cluster-containing dehydrogenase component
VARCEGCSNCLLACKDEHCGNDWFGYAAEQPRHGQRWIALEYREHGVFPLVAVSYLPLLCQHCTAPPCLERGGEAVRRRSDGIVLIDPRLARGRRDLVDACPYGAIFWNEERQLPQKCTLCAHLLDDGWSQPRCVQACPTGALSITLVPDDEWAQLCRGRSLEPLHPEFATQPNVAYAHLGRFACLRLVGAVVTCATEVEDCVEGATVRLFRDGAEVGRRTTDPFGEFVFEDLPGESRDYALEVSAAGFGSALASGDQASEGAMPLIYLERER